MFIRLKRKGTQAVFLHFKAVSVAAAAYSQQLFWKCWRPLIVYISINVLHKIFVFTGSKIQEKDSGWKEVVSRSWDLMISSNEKVRFAHVYLDIISQIVLWCFEVNVVCPFPMTEISIFCSKRCMGFCFCIFVSNKWQFLKKAEENAQHHTYNHTQVAFCVQHCRVRICLSASTLALVNVLRWQVKSRQADSAKTSN